MHKIKLLYYNRSAVLNVCLFIYWLGQDAVSLRSSGRPRTPYVDLAGLSEIHPSAT